ncbi:restriction endonuclease subunit S [Staphylococcus cohnii]|uniref:restriction endonuclease subunit S n=1 Tax=Staphylococcus cohnii TaxID=29382 RepID=UPI003D7ED022
MTNEVRNVPDLRFPGFEGEWEESNIDNEFDFFNNKRKPIKENLRNKGEYPYYGATGIIDYVDDFIFDGNFILIGEDGANIVSRSAPLVYFATGKFWVNNHAHILYPKFGDIYFNYLLLENIDYEKYNTGTAQPKLNVQNLKKIKIKSPRDNSEQQKIGNFFSKLDRQIELEEQKLAKLEEQKKGYMQKIFSQEVRFKDDNGNSYPEWESAPLFDIFSATKGKSLSKDKISDDGKYECILYGEIYTTYAEKIESIVSRTNYYEGILSKKNDLIFPNSTTTNAWDLATFSSLQKNNVLIGGDISILRTKRSDISSLFYAYYLTNYLKLRKDIAKYAQGITIVHLSFNNFCKIKVQILSLEEQNSITDFIDSLNQQQKLITNKIKLLKERKKGFLQKMFV